MEEQTITNKINPNLTKKISASNHLPKSNLSVPTASMEGETNRNPINDIPRTIKDKN